MRKTGFLVFSGLVLGLLVVALSWATGSGQPEKAWSFDATIIEACSCPMFCQCYFNAEPSAHAGHDGHGGGHFCRFNNAFRVNKGKYGTTKLDGLKFWVAGDLGGDFSKGQLDWAVLHFEPTASAEQRQAIQEILGHVYPATWNSFSVGHDAPMVWTASKEHAEARLNGGKTAEVVLNKAKGMTPEPIVIRNLQYWGVPRNQGFVLMPNEVEAYREGDKAFEFKGTNGFMITINMTSKDLPR